jgi:hypothetical protein
MNALPSPIASLFERNAALCGFSVLGCNDIPDSCPRSGDETELFVGDIGISPSVSEKQYADIFKEVLDALSEVLAEEPGAADSLRGRTFARALH